MILTRYLFVVAAGFAGFCSPQDPVDNYPPTGYGAVKGVVTDTAGQVLAGIGISVTSCEGFDFFGDASTNAQGRYQVNGDVPPGGPTPSPASCEIFVGPAFSGPVLSDTISIPFTARREDVIPVVRDFVVP